MIRFTLRLPEEVRDKLIAVAKRNNRSMHAQIIHIILRYLAEVPE